MKPVPSACKLPIHAAPAPQICLAVLSLLCATALAMGLERANRAHIAVADFEVAALAFPVTTATDEGNRWNWAKTGLADLLQIQLQQQGLELLDRDLIHSVLKEQRLAQGVFTGHDQFTVAKLLNAQYLVTGRVIPLVGERFRVEAHVFSVEAIESVAAAKGEGEFPTDISSALESVAGQLASILKTRVSFNPTSQLAVPAPKPESLIMFYRGLDATAHNQPARAVAYFMNAATLDKQFTVPLLWEIRAYEMAGLTNHADIRREEVADLLRSLGVSAVAPGGELYGNAKRVIAVLAPVVTGDASLINPSTIAGDLTRAALAHEPVRVFAPEGISAAAAEQDLKLSALFDAQSAPRYGRWLGADGLLLCRVDASDTNSIIVELSVANPLTASTVARVKREGPLSQLHSLMGSATEELLRQWIKSPGSVGVSLANGDVSTKSFADGVADLRPAYRNLAAALTRVQREPHESGAHSALADAFAATGRPRLAALEIERCLELLDIHAPRADKTFLGTHRWLFWSAQPARVAVGYVDPRAIDRLIERLLTTYPDSLAAGCLHYNLAVSDWRAKHWSNAAAHAVAARKNIRPPAEKAKGDHELFAATYFLEGESLANLGRTNDAKVVFAEGLDYMTQFNVRDFCLPYGPWIDDFFGTEKVYGYGGDRPGIRTRIEEALAKLNGTSAPSNRPPTVTESVATTSKPDSPAVTWLKRADAALQSSYYTDALQAYKRALAEGASLAQCSGLRTALAELALERNRDNAVAEAERCRVELDLPPVVVTWVEWFKAGQKHRTSREFDLEKAAAAYRATMDFIENPERSGQYRLVTEPGWRWKSLRGGGEVSQVDLHWGDKVDVRWNNAASQLAECLIELGRREEAAQWLRRVALDAGGDDMPLLKSTDWFSESYTTVKLGVLAADRLKELHVSFGQPKFGEADGPYKTPASPPRASASASVPPAVATEIIQALNNVLAQARRETNGDAGLACLRSFAERHPRNVVPAVLTCLPEAVDARDRGDLMWLLEQNATTADVLWIVTASRSRWELVPLANRLDAEATAAALAEEWRSYAAKDFVPPDFIRAIINARVRSLFAPVLEQISGKWINHDSVVFFMDRVVAEEKSNELTAAYREALGRCLRLKLEQNDYYGLPRVSQIALRHGVPEAVEATVVCEGASPGKLRTQLAPVLDLPTGDEQMLAYLRANGSRWEWDSIAKKFKPMSGSNEK